MSVFTLAQVKIATVAAAVPANKASNRDYDRLSPQERDMLIKTTGIAERHIAPDGMATSDLCAAAAQHIFEHGVSPADIGILIFVSQSPDYYLPATAALLQHRLGLPKNCIAFDIGLGCSGYVYGLTALASLMKTTGVKKALLLAGDISSNTASPEDKSTYPLFGDAGSATLLELDDSASDWQVSLMTDGSGGQAIMIPDGGARNKLSVDSFTRKPVSEGISRCNLDLVLDGPEIFAFSIREVPATINALLAASNTTPEQIDYLVLHQANKLINETIRKKLKLPPEKVPYSLHQFGNTSSASIPLTLVTALADALKHPCTLLLSGFGVGLSWGGILMQTDNIHCLPLLEL